MRIRYFSDLHVEFQRGFCNVWTPPEMAHDKDTVCVLAGDIDVLKHTPAYADKIAPRFKAVILVLGNHDLWGGTLGRTVEKLRGMIKQPNVYLLENQKVQIDDVEFLGTTLWTDMEGQDPFVMWNAPNKMNDFKKIKVRRGPEHYNRMKPIDWVAANLDARIFLRQNIDKDKLQVVVTHHAPDFACAEGDYHKPSGYYYNTGMQDLVCNAGTWIFGHTHHRFDKYLGDTRVLSNPGGYAGIEPVQGFNLEAYIEV